MREIDQKFLQKQISILVERWGYDEVARVLSALKNNQLSVLERRSTKQSKRVTKKKMSALDHVDRRNLPGEAKRLLSVIAARFENKNFLPSVGDVRYFLDMQGQDATSIKQREGSFVKILDILYKMPHEKLQVIIDDNLYSGPSRLGPLSNEIKMASIRLRNDGSSAAENSKQIDRQDNKSSPSDNISPEKQR